MLRTTRHAGAKHRIGRAFRNSGFSLIELMVTVTIAGILLAVAAPSFATWIRNIRIRNAASEVYAGIQRAKGEAVQRNTLMRFQLTDSLGAGCALSGTGKSWVISQVDPATPTQTAAGKCNVAIDSAATIPRLLATGTLDTSNQLGVSTANNDLVFNALGKLSPAPAADTVINITSDGGNCDASGQYVCLRIVVTPGGQTRMCNPRMPPLDPQAC